MLPEGFVVFKLINFPFEFDSQGEKTLERRAFGAIPLHQFTYKTTEPLHIHHATIVQSALLHDSSEYN